MARTTSIRLDDHFSDFLAREVGNGPVRIRKRGCARLRLLEDQEARLSALRSALRTGEASGEPQPFDFEAFMSAQRS